MSLRYRVVHILLFLSVWTKAQNLVPNYSFENYLSCPAANQFWQLSPWCGLAGGEDAFNVCFNSWGGPNGVGVPYYGFQGFQFPRTGNGFGSILLFGGTSTGTPPNRREYIHVPLLDSLAPGKQYCGTMYLNVSNESEICTDRIGMYLSPNSFPCNQAFPLPQVILPLNVIPQIANPLGNIITDTLNWIEVSGVFTAVGHEKYMTIGNFYDDSNTATVKVYPTAWRNLAYILIDDVNLEEVHNARCARDTIVCAADSFLLGTNVSEAASYTWTPATGLSCINCPSPKAWVSKTTTYTLTKQQCKAITTASVTITIADTCNKVPVFTIPNVFTPNEDGKNDTFLIQGKGITIHSVTIYNRWGNIVYEPVLRDKAVFAWDGTTPTGEKCSEGVYFYVVEYTNSKGESLKKNGYVSLFR